MILLNMKMDNVLSFSNFNVNFSYPKRLKKSSIDNECLDGLKSFRYKKLNIFIGSNASGKTSLIKCIWKILLFITRKERSFIDEIFNKSFQQSYIEIDIVDKTNDVANTYVLRRIKIKRILDNNEEKLLMSCTSFELNTEDSYESRVKDLDLQKDNYIDYLECLNTNNFNFGWNTILPATESGFDEVRFVNVSSEKKQNEYIYVLNQVLKTLDPAIINVTHSLDANDAYVIEHENVGKIIIQEGNKISSIPYLSSGTKYGINIANLLYSIKNHSNGIYLVDEQFSYVNSDVEIAMINTMASLLGPDEQIFFTTHNSNILDIRFPFHSFNFMKKENVEGRSVITCSCATLVENRNNVSPKSILENDMLATAPDVNRIFELGEDND